MKGKKLKLEIEYVPLEEEENEKRLKRLARIILRIMEEAKRRESSKK